MGFLQSSRDVGEVANTEGNCVKIERVILNLRGEDFGVCLEKREGGLVGRGERKRTLATNCQHIGVDVGDNNGDIGVAVELVGVLKVSESDIASSASNVENALRLTRGVRSTRVEGRNKVVPTLRC